VSDTSGGVAPVIHPTPRSWLVRARNPSPMTLDGTNTWVLVEPGERVAIVVDPGPDDAGHRAAVLAAIASAGASEVAVVLLTHGHPDHADGAPAFADAVAAPVRAVARSFCSAATQPLVDGENLRFGGVHIEVVATPGHTADSVCFVVPADAALLTGDTVLGRGSTVVAYPDGRLGDYLESLRRLRALIDERPLRVVLPGHGPVVDDPAASLEQYAVHRETRLAQVRAAAVDARTIDDVLQAVYGDVEPSLQFAARWSLLAQLEYLRESGADAPVLRLLGSPAQPLDVPDYDGPRFDA
jgi:glyoxylase-like metal-dependent hydrolase (beta-lactamase superfamily II)